MSMRSVAVFGSGSVPEGDPAYRTAVELGRGLARRGAVVRCGGYAGVMAGVAAGAREMGGRVVGCTMDWFADSRAPNPDLDEVRSSPDLESRCRCLLEGARAAIALPGGVGTLNEVFWVWTLLLHGKAEGRSLILLGESWGGLLTFLSARFEIDTSTRRLVCIARGVDEAATLACGDGDV